MRHASNEKRQTTHDRRSQNKIKKNKKKDSLRGNRKLLETKLYSRNLVKGLNTWTFSPRKIPGTIHEVDH